MGMLPLSTRKTIIAIMALSIVTILAIMMFASRPAGAPVDNQSVNGVKTNQEDSLDAPTAIQGLSQSQSTSTQSNLPCDEDKTETSEETESGIANRSNTVVECEVLDEGSSTNVNVTNNVDQSAESGSSTGTSGSVSNSSRTEVNINTR